MGLELIEYRDAISKTNISSAAGRIGMLRHRAVVRRIQGEMRQRGIKAKRPIGNAFDRNKDFINRQIDQGVEAVFDQL